MGQVFKPGQQVVVNGVYVGEFVRESAHRVEIKMRGYAHVFIKRGEVVAA